jgi:hypothetical protein
MNRFGIALIIAAILGQAASADAGVVADFVTDWNAALAAGGGVISQGQNDTSGQGQWYYRTVNSSTFAQSDLTWNSTTHLFDNSGTNPPSIGENFTTAPGDVNFTNRLWNTFLAPGEIVRFQGQVQDNSRSGSGATFVLIENNNVGTPLVEQTVTPGNPLSYDFTITLPNNGPTGNFFNFAVGGSTDLIGYTATMTLVPEPSAFVLGGLGAVSLLAAARRRRRV